VKRVLEQHDANNKEDDDIIFDMDALKVKYAKEIKTTLRFNFCRSNFEFSSNNCSSNGYNESVWKRNMLL
jgi:hypothetical protein